MRWVLPVALLVPSMLTAQTPPLSVEGVGEPITISARSDRGYGVYPAGVLATLDARVDDLPGGIRVVFAGDTLTFHAGSAFFTAGGRVHQLVGAPYRQAGSFYLPHQLFAEWLPKAYPDRLTFEDGRLRLKGAVATAEPAATGESGSDRNSDPLGEPAQVPLVVVDAGHGGRDPGRIGPTGLKEKDVVLQVSKRLAKVLAERGYEVRMTRTTDTLIALGARPHMANEWRGSRPGLFLSIHANGVTHRGVNGFETFFLSDARTDDERRVAEMENAAVAYERPDETVTTDDLGLILNNLRNDYYSRASHTLAGLVQDELDVFHRGNNRGVKQAGFRVLVGAFMPAVLIELAFISNPAEERLLGSGRFQVQTAEAIADAVDRFFTSQGELWRGAAR